MTIHYAIRHRLESGFDAPSQEGILTGYTGAPQAALNEALAFLAYMYGTTVDVVVGVRMGGES